ncbi:MAG: hypothetical protein V3V76_10495 [Candidatus Adiutricales bacterium]
MKFFDLVLGERQNLKRFFLWHFGYVIYVALFFIIIFETNLFHSYWILRETWLVNIVAPVHTVIFIVISPYRRQWVTAIVNMYRILDGEIIFCIMAGMVMLLGLYLYSFLIWVLGWLVPAIIYS